MAKNDALAGFSNGGKGKPKSKTVTKRITDPEQIEQLIAIREGKADQKAAKSKVDVAQGEARPWAEEFFETQCRQDGTLHSSIRYTDGDDNTITYTQKAKVNSTSMKEEDAQPVLERVFGDRYDEFFESRQTLSIDTTKLTNDATNGIIEALMAALGDDFYAMKESGAISAELVVAAKAAFFRGRILDVDVRRMAEQASSEGVAVVEMASFKA